MPDRGPPAYNAEPSALADGVSPVHRAPAAVRHDVNGPVGFHGPVAHRQMDGGVAPSNDLMAHRGLVITVTVVVH